MSGCFSHLYGNTNVKDRLGRAIKTSTLPHALILSGPKGSGKRTLALEISAALNCAEKGNRDSIPCYSCNNCRRIFSGNFPDIKYLRRERDKATVGVEEVRIFREDMFLSATESDYKIYIIEESDKMTVNAQNALLKVLEEPPSNVVIILLAESLDKILSTVKSRAETLFLERFSPDEIRRYLLSTSDTARAVDKNSPDTLSGIIMSSGGRIGQALSMLSGKAAEEIRESRELTELLVRSFRAGADYSELYTALSRLPQSRLEFSEAIESLISAIRDIIAVKMSQNPPLTFYTSTENAKASGGGIPVKRLLGIYSLLADTEEDCAKNVGISVLISNLAAKIKLI